MNNPLSKFEDESINNLTIFIFEIFEIRKWWEVFINDYVFLHS